MLFLLLLNICVSLLPISRSVLLLVIVLLLVLVVKGSGATFSCLVFVDCNGDLRIISVLPIRIGCGSGLLLLIFVLVLL